MKNKEFKYVSLGLIWFWLGLFSLIPTLLVLLVSFLSHDQDTLFRLPLTFINYSALLNIAYLKVLFKSIYIAGATTIICLLMGYPFAYILGRMENGYKSILLLLVIIPFWTSSLIRTYAIMVILKAQGIINHSLMWLGIIHQPLQILYSNLAVFIGLTYDFLPFMILPLYANIEKLDESLLEAARDLGASHLRTFFKIVLPLTIPGILAGVMLVFLPAMTIFYIPDLLGGAKSLLLGNLIENQFLLITNWPMGAAISIGLILLLALMILFYWRFSKGQAQEFL